MTHLPIDAEILNFASRAWQHRFLAEAAKLVGSGNPKMLTDVCPAAGKTRAGVALATAMMKAGICDIVVVVAPTVDIVDSWQRTFAGLSVPIETMDELASFSSLFQSHARGIALTYQRLIFAPHLVEWLQRLCASKRVIVILDEIHHTAEMKQWGEQTSIAFAQSAFRLGLSATMFRHDDRSIPLLDYHRGTGIPHFSYTYGEALTDGIVRPVVFRWFGGQAMLEHASDDGETLDPESVLWDYADPRMTNIDRNELLRASLAGQAELVQQMIREADDFTADIRSKYFPQAGCLIIRSLIDDARAGYAFTTEVLGRTSVLATSSDMSVEHPISAFRNGDQVFLHSVGQIREGVDIPRCQVLVYASTTRSQLAFTQAIGRVLRIDGRGTGGVETAHIVCYYDPKLVQLAERMEKATAHELEKARRAGKPIELATAAGARKAVPAAARRPTKASLSGEKVLGAGFTANGMTADEEYYQEAIRRIGESDLPPRLKQKIGRLTRLELIAAIQIATVEARASIR